MLIQKSELVKTISANNAEDFDTKLNSKLQELGRKGIQYTLELAPQLGFTAFIRYKETFHVPETIADEFELGGETHRCIECPFYVRPTDGRVKYTRCSVTPGLHSRDSYCCDAFYQKLLDGEIQLVDVMDIDKVREVVGVGKG